MCSAHYYRFLKYGDVGAARPVASWHKNPQCTIKGCKRKAIAKGMCSAHYSRVNYYGGDPQADKPFKGQTVNGKSWCSSCRRLLPLSAFAKSHSRSSGVDGYCRECHRELADSKYHEAIAKAREEWRKANRDKMRSYQRSYLLAHPDRRSLSSVAYKANRRIRLAVNGGEATPEQIQQRWEYFGCKCWMCGAAADSTDHVKPVSKGGSGWPANLRPICRSCNSAKNNLWPFPVEVTRGRSTIVREGAPRTPVPITVD